MSSSRPDNWGYYIIGFWVVRELFGFAKSYIGRRLGRTEFVPDDCGFYGMVQTTTGAQFEAKCHPNTFDKSMKTLPLSARGVFLNNSGVNVIFQKPRVTFYNQKGKGVETDNVTFVIDSKQQKTLTLGPHSQCNISVSVSIIRADLDSSYAQSLPVLEVENQKGKKKHFKLSNKSFYGEPETTWQDKSYAIIRK